MKKLLALLGTSLLLTSAAQAVTVNVSYDAGTVNTTTALTGYATTGSMMDGMSVTAYFAGGGSQTVLWSDTGASSGAAVGSGWSLAETGDTFGGLWTLSNTGNSALTRLVIDAGVGDTVFDTTFSGFGTDGSANGWTFQVNSIGAADANDRITAVYRNAVALGAAAPVGDLFRLLDVTFADGLSAGSWVKYITDTDNLLFAGDLTPTPDGMSTVLGLGIAMLGFGLIARRRTA